MAKAWKIIGTIVLVILILGALGIGVGMLTGGSIQRILESYFGSYEAFEFVRDTVIDTVNDAISSIN